MIQTVGLEGVTAVNSSSFGAMGTPFEPEGKLKRKREEELDGLHRDKRPATAYTTPTYPLNGGFMAIQRSLFSTNEGTQIKMMEATLDEEASTSSWAPPQVELKTFTSDERGQGSIEEPSLYYAPQVHIQDAFPDMDISDFFLDHSPDLDVFTGNLAGSSNVASNCEGELRSSTMPLTAGAMNSTGTGEPHHDPLGKQGESTAAAGSFSGPTTRSSPHNEMF